MKILYTRVLKQWLRQLPPVLYAVIAVLSIPDVRAQSLSDSYAARRARHYSQNHEKTLAKASRKGWPLSIELGKGRSMQLQYTDALGQPVYYSVHSTPVSAGSRTDALYSGGSLGLNLSGQQVALRGKMGLWDGGEVRATHRELSGKISQNETPNSGVSDHATHMAGTLVARGARAEARGMAYNAALSVWDYTNDISEIIAQAPNLLLSNHAYGPVTGWVLNPNRPGTSNDLKWEWWGTPTISSDVDYRYGFYDQPVSDVDRITYNHPYYLMVRSADNKRGETGPPAGTAYYLRNTTTTSTLPRSRNDSYDVIPGEALAKNVLTVGAATLLSTAFELASYSGWGPTDDGRIKPDVLGIGTNVLSSLGTADDAYGAYSGTSMASANVTGSLYLLQELYYQQHSSFMLSSTLKGIVLHTAEKPAGKAAPSYQYGWGMLNAEKAAKTILNTEGTYLVEENFLDQAATYTRKLVASGNEPLVVTICWTDPEGAATTVSSRNVNNPNPKLINDLDLLVAEGFTNNLPWVLDPARPEQEAQRGNNFRDNVEQIYIPAPVKGRTYTLTITHKGTLKNGRQPFSLVVSGLAKPDCELAATLSPAAEATLCPGNTLVLAANAGGDFTYEWYLNESSIKKGPERKLEVSQPGSYSVQVSGQGCRTTSKPVTVRTSNLLALVNPGGKLVVCNSNGLLLKATTGAGYGYQWLLNDQPIPEATTAQWQARVSGNYRVQITEGTCSATSAPSEVQITPVTASLKPSGEAAICNDTPALLSTQPQQNCTYTWYRDGTPLAAPSANAQYSAASPGLYSVEVRNGDCKVKSAEVLVRRVSLEAVILAPPVLQLKVGDSLTLQANYAIGNRYQWYRDTDMLTGATAPQLVVKERGTYRVSISNRGCQAESQVITVSVSGLTLSTPAAADSLSTFILYPNPTQQVLEVTVRQQPGVSGSTRVTLSTMPGQPLQSQLLLPQQGYWSTQFNVAHLPPGTYTIYLRIGQRPLARTFIKQ